MRLIDQHKNILRIIVDSFPYILKAQLWRMFERKKSRSYEIIRELVADGILGENKYNGVDYVYPLKKLMVWHTDDPTATAMRKTPSDTLLLDCFMRAEHYIRRPELLTFRDSGLLKSYLPTNNDLATELKEIDQGIKDLEGKKPRYNDRNMKSLLKLKDASILNQNIVDKANSRNPLNKINRHDIDQINQEIQNLKNNFIELADKVEKSAYNHGLRLKEWQINLTDLQEEKEDLLKKANIQTPPTVYQNEITRLTRNWSPSLSKMPNKTEIEQLQIMDAVINQLKSRNCYLIDSVCEITNDETNHLAFTIVGFGESSRDRYYKALRLFRDIALCFKNTPSLIIVVLCPDQGQQKAIERKFRLAVNEYSQNTTIPIKKGKKLERDQFIFINTELDRYWKGGNDPKTHYKVDKQSIQEAVSQGMQ